MKATIALLAVGLCGALSGCAYQGDSEGIQASERHECQKYVAISYEECLERARTGTVFHTPERFETGLERRLRH